MEKEQITIDKFLQSIYCFFICEHMLLFVAKNPLQSNFEFQF